MKKIFILFLLFASVGLYAANINLTATSANSLTTVFNANNVKFLLSTSINDNGRYVIKSSPVFSYSTKGLYLGELKPNGAFSIMQGLDTTLSKENFDSFSTPSYNPSYCGFAFENKNLAFFASNPVFCPSSYHSGGVSVKNNLGYVGIMFVKKNQFIDALSLPFQLKWSELGNTFDYYFVIGTNHKSTNLGFNLNVGNKQNSFEASLTKGLLTFSFFESLTDTTTFSFGIKAMNFLESSYSITKNKPSLYGGKAQSIIINFSNKIEYDKFTLSSASIIDYKEDTGRFVQTDYKILFKTGDCSCDISSTYQRTNGLKNGFSNLAFSLNFDEASVSLKDKKLYLSINFDKEFNNSKLRITVNQNKLISINLNQSF